MKVILLSVFGLLGALMIAQSPITEIEGFLDVHHHEDSTSIYIGHDAGIERIPTNFPRNSTFVGFEAGKSNSSNQNSYFGYQAGASSSGEWNTFIGHRSGMNSIGGDNTFIGWRSGINVRRGSRNICIGASAGPAVQDSFLSNRLYIDNGSSSTPLIFGNFSSNLVKIHGELNVTDQFRISEILIEQSGDDAIFKSSTSVLKPSSDFIFITNDNFRIDLDNNGGDSGEFEVYDESDNRILLLKENGDLTIDGDYITNSPPSFKSKRTKKHNSESTLKSIEQLNLYTWTDLQGENHMGFDHEEFNELFNLSDKNGVSLTDITSVNTSSIQLLLKTIKEQQETIVNLTERVHKLEQK